MAGRITLMGGPGAGKGTQAHRLVEKHGWVHISTGDIFRSHIENGTEFGKQIEDYMNSGKLVPDELVCEIIAGRLAEEDCRAGFILDGFPRSVVQAEELDRMIAALGESLDAAIVLDVDDEEIVARLTARRTCPKCGQIYNLKFNPSANGEVCENAACEGAQLEQREDDKEDTIRRRLNIYHETTEPVIAYYGNKGLIRRVDGADSSPDVIAANIESVLMAQGAM